MMNSVWNDLVRVVVTIIIVAILAAVLSKKAQTTQVISSASSVFNFFVKAIVSPITGA